MYKKFVILIILALTLVYCAPIQLTVSAQATTVVGVDPPRITGLSVYEIFSINVNVTDVVDLYAWGFSLYYSNAVLNATEWTFGSFLASGGSTYGGVAVWDDFFNETHGRAHISQSLIGNISGVSGSGVLATITFKAIYSGNSALDLELTVLVDSAVPFGHPIPHEVIDGSVHVGLRDVAITNVEAPKSIPTDTIARINITGENQGEESESFDVALYYDSNPIETKSIIDLPGGDIKTLNFMWDVSPLPMGEYTLKAEATQVPGEVDLSDNTYVFGIIYVGLRDIAISNTVPSKTVTNDTTVYINVALENRGEFSETLNVTVYYNLNPIETQAVANLPAGSTITLIFTWGTFAIPKGSYEISVTATTVPGEIDTENNHYLDGTITETILGDVTGEGKVDIVDIATIAKAYYTHPGDPKWNGNADLDNSNLIDIIDIAKAAKNYGKEI